MCLLLGNIVFRDCVDKLLNECSTDFDQQVRVKVCYNSCSDDGCNNKPISASGRASRTFSMSLLSAAETTLIVVLATAATQACML